MMIINIIESYLLQFINSRDAHNLIAKMEAKNDTLTSTVQGKEIVIESQEKMITEFEEKVAELEALRDKLTDKLIKEENNSKEMNQIMHQYENLLSNMVEDRDHLLYEKEAVKANLNQLKNAFDELHNKYEKAKVVIEGLEQNEKSLTNQIKMYKNALALVEDKYLEFKRYAVIKLNEANNMCKEFCGDQKTPRLPNSARSSHPATPRSKMSSLSHTSERNTDRGNWYKMNHYPNLTDNHLIEDDAYDGDNIFKPLVSNFK